MVWFNPRFRNKLHSLRLTIDYEQNSYIHRTDDYMPIKKTYVTPKRKFRGELFSPTLVANIQKRIAGKQKEKHSLSIYNMVNFTF